MKQHLKNIIYAVSTSVLILAYLYRFQIWYAILSFLTPKINAKNQDKTENLHPIFKYRFFRFVKDLEKDGYNVTFTSGFRSFLQQQNLYNAGSTTAKAGSSFHNYGMATDLNVTTPNGTTLKMNSPKNNWLPVETVAKKYGLRWGGNFSNFYDPVHFDMGENYKISDLRKLYDNRKFINKESKIVKTW